MAHFLFATWPSVGHVNPVLPLAQRLIQKGHRVTWYTSSHFQAKVEATGATYEPFRSLRDFSGSTLAQDFPEMPNHKGLKLFKWGIRNIIAYTMEGFDKDLTELRRCYQPDVLVIDPTFTGLIPMRLRGDRQKTACYGILPLSLASKDTPPFGLGLLPDASSFGRVRDRFGNFFFQKVLFGGEQRYFNRILRRMGLPQLKHYFFDVAVHDSDLYLQGTCPSFEYPRRDLPGHVRFVGPFNPTTAAKQPLPEWWPEIQARKPVVHVTQGTLANEDFNRLLVPTIQALADKDVLVVATTGNRPESEVRIPLPKNVRLERFIPYAELMPHVDVMVTNGGYGGVHWAIQHGVPLVVAGKTEDKPEVCARVEWAGIGVNLKTDSPSPEQIARAVDELLATPRYKQRALDLQAEFTRYDAYQLSVQHLEELASRPA